MDIQVITKTTTKAANLIGNRYLSIYKALGDGLWGVSTTITGFAMYNEVHWLGYTALITGVIGKFIVNAVEELRKDDQIRN